MTAMSRHTGSLSPNWRDELFAMIRRQHGLCRGLAECTRQQCEALDDNDPDRLTALLERRQSLIDELVSLGADLEPYRDAWPDLWGRLDPCDRERLDVMLDEVHRLLADTRSEGESQRSRISDSRRSLQGQLDQIANGRTSIDAYGARPADHARRGSNRFMDEHG